MSPCENQSTLLIRWTLPFEDANMEVLKAFKETQRDKVVNTYIISLAALFLEVRSKYFA